MANIDKYRGKYRIPSARWAAWDYGANPAYFVTICTAHRTCDFGTIANGTMNLSLLGQSARGCWNEIPAHFPFVELGEFVVMPIIFGIHPPSQREGGQGDGRNDLSEYDLP